MTLRTRHTVVRATSRLTKEISRGADGKLVKLAAVSPYSGVLLDVAYEGLSPRAILTAFADDLTLLRPNEALLLSHLPSPLAPDGGVWELCVKAVEESMPGALARSKANFGPVDGLALGFFDFDLPEAARASIPDAQALLKNILIPAWPGFAETAMLIRPSVSSGARLAGQTTPPPVSGFHCFLVLDDGEQIGEIAKRLFDRLASTGHAVVLPSASGARLRRALVDAGASSPERLIFEADPVLGDGVEAVPREPYLSGDRLLAAADILRDLEAVNQRDAEKRAAYWAEAERIAAPACAAAKRTCFKRRVKQKVAEHRMPLKAACKAVRREMLGIERGVLWDDDRIVLDDGSEPTVYEILSDPDTYAWARGQSLDEHPPRRGVTIVCPYERPADPSIGRPPGPYLHSYEHGGRYWRLRSKRIAPAAALLELLAEELRDLIGLEFEELEAAR